MVGRERKGGGGDGKPTLNINAGCGPALAHIALNPCSPMQYSL